MIVAIGQRKGGVGKTTTALSLATEAVARGLRVLVVDADDQRSAAVWAEVAAEHGRTGPTVVEMTKPTLHRPEALPTLAPNFDLVLVDLPPRSDALTRSALMVADVLVSPSGGHALDVWALGETLALIEEAQVAKPALKAAIVITRAQATNAIGRGARGVLEDAGVPVLRAALGLRVTYPEAIAAGMGPTTYAPKSEAADEVRALFDEINRFGGVTYDTRKTRHKHSATQVA